MNKEEFGAWRTDPITEQVFGILREVRAHHVERLTSGQTVGAETDTAKTVGIIQAFDYLLNIDYEDNIA